MEARVEDKQLTDVIFAAAKWHKTRKMSVLLSSYWQYNNKLVSVTKLSVFVDSWVAAFTASFMGEGKLSWRSLHFAACQNLLACSTFQSTVPTRSWSGEERQRSGWLCNFCKSKHEKAIKQTEEGLLVSPPAGVAMFSPLLLRKCRTEEATKFWGYWRLYEGLLDSTA